MTDSGGPRLDASEPTSAQGSAPGKLLLLGEHAVVYGSPAVGFPIPQGVKVVLRPGSGTVHTTLADGLAVPSAATKPVAPKDLVRRALGDDSDRIDAEVRLGVPPMCGYGSSAALAVALIRAGDALSGRADASRPALWRRALEVEREAHARPSGVDPAIVVWGSPIVFQRGWGGRVRVREQRFGRPVFIVAGWCGDHGGTKASVSGLARLREHRPRLVGAAMKTLAEAARAGSAALAAGELAALGPALDLAHGVLSGLGLVGEEVEAAVRRVRDLGALGAKMSGAGGRGGAWLAVFDSQESAARAEAKLKAGGTPVLSQRLG